MFIIFSYYDIFDRVICITHFGLHGACLSHFVVVSIQVSSHYELHYDMYLVLMWGNAQEPDDVLMAYRTVEINCIFILKLSKGCQYSPKKMFSIIMVKSPLINRMFSIIMVKSPLINRMFVTIMVKSPLINRMFSIIMVKSQLISKIGKRRVYYILNTLTPQC